MVKENDSDEKNKITEKQERVLGILNGIVKIDFSDDFELTEEEFLGLIR
jgi:hypothetical protein